MSVFSQNYTVLSTAREQVCQKLTYGLLSRQVSSLENCTTNFGDAVEIQKKIVKFLDKSLSARRAKNTDVQRRLRKRKSLANDSEEKEIVDVQMADLPSNG